MNEQPQIWIQEVKNLIASGKTEKAIEHFLSKLQADEVYKNIETKLILIASDFNSNKQHHISGLIAYSDTTSQAFINKRLLDLLCNVEDYISKGNGKYLDEVSELRKRFIMAGSQFELKRISFEVERIITKQPDNFEAVVLYDQVQKSIRWEEISKHNYNPPKSQNDIRSNIKIVRMMRMVTAVFIFIILAIIFYIKFMSR